MEKYARHYYFQLENSKDFAGAFLAAAAMATGSAVTAAPAKADFEDLLDPIIQPLLTSLTDSLAGFDPAAAADLTSWTDSLLSSLNLIDLGAALPLTAEDSDEAVAAISPTSPFTPSVPFDTAVCRSVIRRATVRLPLPTSVANVAPIRAWSEAA